MVEQEGVIKYTLDFQRQVVRLNPKILREINHSRQLMIDNALLGQDDERYCGYGFGNISCRGDGSNTCFVITGSQTGHLRHLSNDSFACISKINSKQNTLHACGETEPSSESMTHGVLYQQHCQIRAVVHVHSPDIWHASGCLNLASTAKEIPYGTPEMAHAVQALTCALMKRNAALPMLFVMKGHEDGVVAAGASLAQCNAVILDTLQRAKQCANA